MKSHNLKYIPALDHLRAYGALLIVFYHGLHLFSYQQRFQQPFSFDHWPLAGSVAEALVIEGHTVVGLFMVLSGFVLTLGSYGKPIDYRRFLKNRLLRTYPLFLFFLLVGSCAFPDKFSLPAFLQTIGGLANLHGSLHVGPFSAMFWVVAVEWQFYVIFPFLLAVVEKRGAGFLGVMLVLFMLVRFLAFGCGAGMRDLAYWMILGRMDQFILGMLAAVYYRRFGLGGRGWFAVLPLAVAGILALLLFFNRLGGWPVEAAWKGIWPTVEGGMWGLFLLAYLRVADLVPGWLSRGLTFLGTISYSIFLIHFIVISLLAKQQVRLDLGLDYIGNALVTTLCLALPMTLVLAGLTYGCIEKPFLELRGKYHRDQAGAGNQ